MAVAVGTKGVGVDVGANGLGVDVGGDGVRVAVGGDIVGVAGGLAGAPRHPARAHSSNPMPTTCITILRDLISRSLRGAMRARARLECPHAGS